MLRLLLALLLTLTLLPAAISADEPPTVTIAGRVVLVFMGSDDDVHLIVELDEPSRELVAEYHRDTEQPPTDDDLGGFFYGLLWRGVDAGFWLNCEQPGDWPLVWVNEEVELTGQLVWDTAHQWMEMQVGASE